MKVRATAMGFHGGFRRREGDVFEVPAGTKATWFEPASKPVKPREEGDQAPRTMSEASKLLTGPEPDVNDLA